MKITIELEGRICTIEEDVVCFEDVCRAIKDCCVGVGYHQDTVDRYFN